MRIKFQKIPMVHDRSFVYFNVVHDRFNGPLHYHPEIEITEITYGHGYRIIGGHQEAFEAGDFVLIGSGIYHGYFGDAASDSRQDCARVLQFEHDTLSVAFSTIPELKPLVRLFQNDQRAIILTGQTRHTAHHILTEFQESSGIQAMLKLLDILRIFVEAPTEDVRILNNPLGKMSETNYQQFNDMFVQLQTQYSEPITLADMAQYTGLSYSAFSRSFRKITGRTFVRYLREIRIAHACRLLIETDLHVYQIADQCGFRNISNFNRCFRKIKQTTPQQFRQIAHRVK